MRQALVGEVPGLEVEEVAGSVAAIRSLAGRRFDLAVVRHPLPNGDELPVVLKARWPERALLLYAPLASESRLAAAVEAAGDAYFLDSGTELPGLRVALRLALARTRPGTTPRRWREHVGAVAAVLATSNAGILLTSVASGSIFDVNDRFLDLIGRDRGEVIGRTATAIGLWVAFPEEQIVRMLADAGRLRQAEVRFRTKHGRVRQGLLSVERLSLDGMDALLWILEDVTDLRRATAQREELRQSERRARARAEDALAQLRESDGRLESLSRRLVEVQEVERRALARDLHDEVGQILAGLELQLDAARTAVPAEVHQLLRQLSQRVLDLAMELRPPMLDEMGLVPTLLWHFERYEAQTGVHVQFRRCAPVDRMAPQAETAAFRIVQEALSNVARHAGVREASVRLDVHPDRLELRIEDRGAGFRPEPAWAAASSGLTGMRDRARLSGGRLSVDSAPGRGTRVTAELPRSPARGRAR